MFTISRFGRLAPVVIIAGAMALASSARAQDVAPEHLQAARAAVTALGITDQFDNILPGLADRLKSQLIATYPNLEDQINEVVDKKAIELAARRADLERESALVYARSFSAEELRAIADFYNGEAGKKFLRDGPVATREMLRAADIWAAGVSRDMNDQTNDEMIKLVDGASPAAAPAPAPAPAP